MKYQWYAFISLFIGAFLAGCASTPSMRADLYAPAYDLQRAKMEISRANQELISGDYEKAQASFQVLIDNYPELDNRYQCGFLTNAALSSLQLGDGKRFYLYATQLEKVVAGIRPLPRNTQIVLAILKATGKGEAKDLWISQHIEQAVQAALDSK